MDFAQKLFTKRNIATFLIVGILVLSIPFGLKLTESQKKVSSQAAENICLDLVHMDHAPLYNIDFYRVIEDSDDGACVSGTHYTGEQACGFIWRPSHGKLHLGLWDTSRLGSCPEQDKSFCSDAYYSVINNPLFPVAVALIHKMFRLDQTNYIFAVSNPALGGRGDDRAFDPAWNVAQFLNDTSKSFFHQLNPNNIHDPVEWLYDRGFWARSNPAPTGKGFQEEYYGHYQNSFNVNPQGHIGMTPDKKSLVDYIKQNNLRRKNWTELACGAGPSPSPSASLPSPSPSPSPSASLPSPSPSPSPSASLPSPSPSPSGSISLTCDFNKDNKYDDRDFKIWSDEFTGQKTTKRADCSGNQIVDLVDFNLWRDQKIERE